MFIINEVNVDFPLLLLVFEFPLNCPNDRSLPIGVKVGMLCPDTVEGLCNPEPKSKCPDRPPFPEVELPPEMPGMLLKDMALADVAWCNGLVS